MKRSVERKKATRQLAARLALAICSASRPTQLPARHEAEPYKCDRCPYGVCVSVCVCVCVCVCVYRMLLCATAARVRIKWKR